MRDGAAAIDVVQALVAERDRLATAAAGAARNDEKAEAKTEALRAQIRRFCEKEILPHMEAWEEAGEMPREV